MTPEAARFLAKASDLHQRARKMLDMGLAEDAGREAYMAGFHAAQALIFESTGRPAKTHNGVHAEFQRITRDDDRFASDIRSFLSTA